MINRILPLLGLLLLCVCVFGQAPQPGWVTTAKVIDVYDGDTVTVEIRKTIKVRLLDCWAPEIRTKDLEEKAKGLKARDYLRSLIDQKEVILSVPVRGNISKSFSFGRALGRIYIDGKDVSESMVEAGLATKEKQE